MAISSTTVPTAAFPAATMKAGACIRILPAHVMQASIMERTAMFARLDIEKTGFRPQVILITKCHFPVMNASRGFGTVCRAINNARRASQGNLALPLAQHHRTLASRVLRVKAPPGRLGATSVTNALMASSRMLLGCQAVTNAV